MKVLVACEYSGTVRDAFRAKGHDAISCDLLPTDAEGPHIQGDCVEVIRSQQWDLIIMHPPCTALTVAGNHVYGEGKARHSERLDAVRWTVELWQLAKSHACRVCMENPVGVLPRMAGLKPAQYIQPYEFGEDASKKTGLWLHNLQLLVGTSYFEPRVVNGAKRWGNQTDSGQNKLPPSADRWKIRSKTYQGIADAMADQWG